MGRKRCCAAATIASIDARPDWFNSICMRSMSTIALLMTIPASEINPRKAKKPKNERKTSNPAMTPIRPSGMVLSTIKVLRKELNWTINSARMIKPDSGSLATTALMASLLCSDSPPNS